MHDTTLSWSCMHLPGVGAEIHPVLGKDGSGEGFLHLKTWRGGPDAGKPKLPPTAKGLIARGLMRLDNEGHFPRLFFTEAGLAALRAMMTDRRLVDPKKFAHAAEIRAWQLYLAQDKRLAASSISLAVSALRFSPYYVNSALWPRGIVLVRREFLHQ